MAGGAQPAPVPYLRTIKTLAGRIPIQRRLIDCAPNAVPTIAAPLWSTLTEVGNCTELLVTASLSAQQVGTPASNFCLCVQSIDPVMWGTIFTPEQGGAGYLPLVTFTGGGGGSGAAATPVVSGGAITGFTGLVGGTGYTSAPTVTISGGGGSGASVTATVAGGAVTGFTGLVGGTGFGGLPTATISGDGTGATVNAVGANGRVVGFSGLVGGSGYTYATVALSGGAGSGAAAYAVVSGGAVIGVFLVSSAGFLPGEAVSVSVPHGGLGVITDQTTLAVPRQAQLQPAVFGGFVRAGIWATVPFPTNVGKVSVTLQGK